MSELIKNIPVVALRGMTILPSMITHFDISREKSVKAVEAAMLRDQRLVVLTQKSPETQEVRWDVSLLIKQIMKLPQNIFRVLAEGLERVEVMDLDVADGCLVADAATFSEEELALPDEKNQEAMVQTLRTIFQDYCQANGKISRETALQIMEQTDLQKMVDQIAVNIPVFYEEKQKLLEAVDLTERFEQLSVLLENEIQVMNIKTEIQEKVKARIDKNQREYILREQLKLIREERITAFIAAESTTCAYLYSLFATMNLRVPEDISLMSFDKPLVESQRPDFFTHISQSEYLMGKEAGTILKHQIETRDPQVTHRVMSPLLEVRKSTRAIVL